MNHFYITIEAIEIFVSTRQFQSSEYIEGWVLSQILRGENMPFNYGDLHSSVIGNTRVFYNNKPTFFNGLFFDCDQFDGFEKEDDSSKIITIFQKVLKYSMRYYKNLPPAPCEINLLGTHNTAIFPFPLSERGNATRILVDRNSSKYKDKDKNILTVFYSGQTQTKEEVRFDNLYHFFDLYKNFRDNRVKNEETSSIAVFQSYELGKIDLKLDSLMGLENWNHFLTKSQLGFINRPIGGAERLEGAAGTGKTLSMVLRCLTQLLQSGFKKKFVFITHSIASRNSIIDIFKCNYPDISNYICKESDIAGALLVTTIQEWCIKYLGSYISETEYLDKDAAYSKGIQRLYIEEAYKYVKKVDYPAYSKICSEKFVSFIDSTSEELLFEILQYEISVVIKGRANGDIEQYKKFERPTYGIPCENTFDYNYLYRIYQEYQKSLEASGQFDSDDIVLTALSQLQSPIWKRRRDREGFDACFVDETHLFNLNELSILHFLNKTESQDNIIFAIDKSQYAGELTTANGDMYYVMGKEKESVLGTKFKTVFRSSTDILNLAFSVLSSGVSAFRNFDNPLSESTFNFTAQEERKCEFPEYLLLRSEDKEIEQAFKRAEKYITEHDCSRNDILITATSDLILKKLESFAKRTNKIYETIKSRGDSSTLGKAKCKNGFVIGGIDYVGGLEFDYVVIVGVDDYNVPPKSNNNDGAFHFSNYAWHNRMYVAITRAKFGICLIGDKTFGTSSVFESSINKKYVSVINV